MRSELAIGPMFQTNAQFSTNFTAPTIYETLKEHTRLLNTNPDRIKFVGKLYRHKKKRLLIFKEFDIDERFNTSLYRNPTSTRRIIKTPQITRIFIAFDQDF